MIIKYDDKEVKTFQDCGKHFDDKNDRNEISTVSCECGNNELLVNYIPAPYTGCFLKLTCKKCNKSEILFDDFS